MKEELLEKIERLHELEKYQEIIDLIESLPAEQLNTDLIGQLGRAYNNVENYAKGLEILKTIEFEEGHSLLWNWRTGYSYFFLADFVNAEKCFLKAYELDPDDNDTCDFLTAIYTNLAKLENKNGNSEKAIEYALESKKYVHDEEGRVEADSFLAWLYDRYEEYTKAEEILRNQLARNKDDEWTLAELAYCLSEQGKYEEALEYFFAVEKVNKEDAWTYRKIGMCYKNLNKREDALKYYLKAVELDEEDKYSLSDIAWLYDSSGKYEEALKYLERLNELGEENDAWTNTEFGYCLSKLQRYEDAVKKLNHALEVEDAEKDTAYIYGLLGWCKRHLKEYDEAIEAFTQAKKCGRNDAWINVEIGRCYKEKDNKEEALEYYLQAEKLDKKDPYLMSDIAWHYDVLGQYNEGLKYIKKAIKLGRNDVWINVEYASCLAGLNKYEEAIEKFEYALSLEVEDEDERDLAFIYSQLGWCHRQLGNYEKALDYHIKSKEEGRNDPWINVEIAMCYENLGDYEKALDYALIAYDLDRDDIRSLSEVGWIYDCMDKYEDGLPFLLRAEELGRDDEWLNTEIALNLGRNGKIKEAIERLNKSLTMVEEDNISQRIFINSEMAWLYGNLEEPQPEEALKYLNAAKELGRDDEWIHSQIGYQLGYNPEKFEEALEHFERAIELGRNDAWIFEVKGIILLDLGRYEEALDSFRKAYAEDNNGWYLYSMGRCLRGLERYEEAIEVLLESRQISLDEEDVVDGEDFELAYCYIGIGDKDNAQKYLDSARDSVTKRGTLNDYMKEKIEEIEKGILSLDQFLN